MDGLLFDICSIDAVDEDTGSLLHWAAREGHTEIARILIGKHQIDVDAFNKYKWTPLHWTAKEGHYNTAKLLLENKADRNLKTGEGETAIDVAQRYHENDIINLLKTLSNENARRYK